MIRRVIFWSHLCLGVAAGLLIFSMAATGVLLSFERQMTEFADREIRSVSAPSDSQPLPLNHLLDMVRRAGIGEPTAFTVRHEAQAAVQFAMGRGKAVYADPYSGAVLGVSSPRAHEFFATVERFHRTLGAPLGSKSAGRWLTGVSNLLFGVLILLGIILWLPRKWSWISLRASTIFRTSLRGKAREWNWHNVLGIWCALPLLVIVLSGVVMSFDWANVLLFRLSGSPAPTAGRGGGERFGHGRDTRVEHDPNYDQLLTASKSLNADWRTITLNIAQGERSPVSVSVDAGAGGQPQERIQYLLNRETGQVLKTTQFSDGSLGQRLRAFVRFGHTGEFGGWLGQWIAAIASFSACVLVYTGFALSLRRLAAVRQRSKRIPEPMRQAA